MVQLDIMFADRANSGLALKIASPGINGAIHDSVVHTTIDPGGLITKGKS